MSKANADRQDYLYPQPWCLHHHGVDPRIVREIVLTMSIKAQRVEVPEANGRNLTLPAFREAIRASIAKGHVRFVMLLSRDFTGPQFKQTLAPIIKDVGFDVSFYPVRIEWCDSSEVDHISVDLAELTSRKRRREAILKLAPSSRSVCC